MRNHAAKLLSFLLGLMLLLGGAAAPGALAADTTTLTPPTTVGAPASPTPVTAPQPPTPTPTPTPTTTPIVARSAIENVGGLPVAGVISEGQIRVVGTVKPYIAGQAVIVRTFRGRTELEARQASIVNIGNGVGHFATLIGAGGLPGPVQVTVRHEATDLEGAFSAPVRHIAVVSTNVSAGARGPSVRLLQAELNEMHFAVPLSGVFDDATGRAVMAFRKLNNLLRDEQANRLVFDRLAHATGTFQVRYPRQGNHFEGDLTHQVLAEVMPGGKVRKIYEMSSGKPSTPTVIGNFSVYLKTFGTNEKGMVDANYFIRGYAIHGYFDVPPYPASHGCLRIPIPDAAAVYAWARFGFPVDVYYRGGGGSHRVMSNAGP